MKNVVVLAMHGAPPSDFPRHEMAEFFSLRSRLDHSAGPDRAYLERRWIELENKMRLWPRTAQNDPYHAGAQELAARMREVMGCPVIAAFGEFCAPSLDEALAQAAAEEPQRVIVATPMMTRGGEHSERDIPEAVDRARRRFPQISFIYAWPFESPEIAQFLAAQIRRFLEKTESDR